MSTLLRWSVVPALGVPLLLSAGCDLMVAGHGTQAKASDVWERSYDLGATPSLTVSNTNGGVTVQAYDGTRIEVRAERSVQAASDQAARDLLAATMISEVVEGQTVSLTTTRPSGFSRGQRAQIRYDIRVPRDAAVSLRTTNGALTVDDVRGVIEVETVNGRVRGTGLSQVRRAETVNGSVEVSLDRLTSEGATFETVNGSVRLHVAPDLAAALSVRTVNGSITVTALVRVDEGERGRRRFDATLNGGGPPLRIETVNGSVTVQGRRGASE